MTEKEKAYERERYAWYKEHGICVRCGQEKAKENHTVCWSCLANMNDYSRIYYHSKEKPRSDEQLERDKESRNRYVENRHSQGLCWRCGLRPPIGKGKYSQCRICADKAAKQKRERERAKGSIPQILRGNGTYCFHCCKPICNGEKLCPECLERVRKHAEIARTYIDHENHPWRGLDRTDIQEAKEKC